MGIKVSQFNQGTMTNRKVDRNPTEIVSKVHKNPKLRLQTQFQSVHMYKGVLTTFS